MPKSSHKTRIEPPADPRPEPPEAPLPGDCCGSGCDRCVYVIHEEAMDAYREALREWEGRQAGVRPGPH